MDDSASIGLSFGFTEPLAIQVVEASGLEPGGEPFVTTPERFLERESGSSGLLGRERIGTGPLAFADRLVASFAEGSLFEDPLARMGGIGLLGIGAWLSYLDRLFQAGIQGY